MITAILYTSNTGGAERYAIMLGEKLELPAHALDNTPMPAGQR